MNYINKFIIGFLLFGCNTDVVEKETVEMWNNPEINFDIAAGETPIKQFPFDKNLPDKERTDSLGLIDFFERMSMKFEYSGFSVYEAEKIYDVLFEHELIRDDSYGMPSPDIVSPPLTLEDLKLRMSILKITSTKCEVHFWYIGCGRNFSHAVIQFSDGLKSVVDIKETEGWSASYPC